MGDAAEDCSISLQTAPGERSRSRGGALRTRGRISTRERCPTTLSTIARRTDRPERRCAIPAGSRLTAQSRGESPGSASTTPPSTANSKPLSRAFANSADLS